MFTAILGLFPAIIFTIILFLINPILGVVGTLWFVGLGIYAWNRDEGDYNHGSGRRSSYRRTPSGIFGALAKGLTRKGKRRNRHSGVMCAPGGSKRKRR